MIISTLTNKRLKQEVLLEANYDLPSDTSSSGESTASGKTTSSPQSQQTGNIQQSPEDLVNAHLRDSGFTEEQMNQIDQETGTSDTADQNQQQDQNDPEQQANDQGQYDIPDVEDNYNPQDDLPKLKILNSISDKEYKLNNLKCYEYFRDLYKNVNDTINNNIMSITTINPRQKQIVDIVHNNLSNMISDLDVYMTLKFSDIYEDNILAYIVFLKRYQIAMKIIKLIIKENIEAKRSEN